MTISEVIGELLRRREEDSQHCTQAKKGGDQRRTKIGFRASEYYTGRQCAFTEAVTLLEKISEGVST